MGYSGLGVGQSVGKAVWLYPIVEKTLKLSGVTPGQKVVIYTDTGRNKNFFDTFFAAASNLGAEVIGMISNPGYGGHAEKTREPPRTIIEIMKESDFVVDLPTNHWCYTNAYNEVLDSGTRILLSCSDEELCIRLAPSEEIARLTEEAARILTGASSVRIVSEAGTDLTFNVEGRICNAQVGYVSSASRWDNFPSGLVEVAPVEDSVNGTLVLAPGDPVVELNRLLTEHVKLTIRDGQIIKIEGNGEAKLLEAWFEQWDDPSVRRVAHIGFGTDHRADLFSGEAMDWESLLGGVNVAFGVNTARFLGGKNHAKAHIDIIVRNANFYADNLPMVKKGELVFWKGRAQAAEEE